MSTNAKAVLTTVEEIMNFMAPYAGGSVPADTDADYADWLRWIRLGQQDAANRGFWRRLLTVVDLEIEANDITTDLPDNFYKVNGIWALFVGDTDWSRSNNDDEVRIFVEMSPDTGLWRIRWLPEAPTSDSTAKLWYFFNPPIVEDPEDIVLLDGEMIGFYALKEYFRKLKQLGSMDDARIEYENRLKELLSLEMLPSQQEMLSFASYPAFRNVDPNGRRMFTGRSGRSRTR